MNRDMLSYEKHLLKVQLLNKLLSLNFSNFLKLEIINVEWIENLKNEIRSANVTEFSIY